MCGLGAIERGALDPINMLLLDPKTGSPESYLGLLPDINKPPLYRLHKSAALPHCALDYNDASSCRALSICLANQPQTFFSPTPGPRLWASL
jgi:hypothetical protein